MQETISTSPPLDVAGLTAALAPKLLDLQVATIVGAQLAPLIDGCLPAGTTYRNYLPADEPSRLRSFVERYLVDLVLPTDERRGSDFLYRIIHAVQDEGVIGRGDGRLWRSFVALKPSRHLAYDSQTAEIGILESLGEASEAIKLISPVTFAEHADICRQFYEQLVKDGVEQPLLMAMLADFHPQTYPMWLHVLRTSRPPLDKDWGGFRQAAILGLFEERLGALDVQGERAKQLVLQLRRDHEQSMRSKTVEPAATADSTPQAAAQTSPRDAKEKRAREALHAAVDRMSYEQIISLSVPFGVILDATGASTSQ